MEPAEAAPVVTRGRVFAVAWPLILSNLSVPLLGLVDTAVVGNLGDAALIGAIAVGAMVFSFVYWGFGFLRMGTTGLVSQAHGAADREGAKVITYRALLLALVLALILLVLQPLIFAGALNLISASAAVEASAASYMSIRIWSAPFTLANFALLGYFVGSQQSARILGLQVLLNGTNIVLDLLFVLVFEWGVPGVAAASVIAELVATVVGVWWLLRDLRASGQKLSVSRAAMLDGVAIRQMLTVNIDIMIRTLCLIFSFAWFTNQGAKSGDVLLATNAILMQFVSFSAFFLDGFSLAAESLAGHAIGGRDRQRLRLVVKFSVQWLLLTALVLGVGYWLAGDAVVAALTNVDDVRSSAAEYFGWVVLAPLVSCWCYLLDGLFIGATRTAEMRNAMIVSMLAYGAFWLLLGQDHGNHGLWASLTFFFVMRALSLLCYMPRLMRGRVA